MKTFNFSLRGCNQFELTPCTSQKSFYGKAKVYTLSNGWKVLQSYWAFVAGIDPQGNVYRFWGGWSATTGKHIRSFCGLNKKEFTDLSLDDLCLSVL